MMYDRRDALTTDEANIGQRVYTTTGFCTSSLVRFIFHPVSELGSATPLKAYALQLRTLALSVCSRASSVDLPCSVGTRRG